MMAMTRTLIILLCLELAKALALQNAYLSRRRSPKQSIIASPPVENNREEIKRERTVVIMYHKPANVITSHSNADAISKTQTEQNRLTVYEDIHSMKGFVSEQSVDMEQKDLHFQTATNIYSKLHAIGRLDAATTGLLLLTNDGSLLHKITNPNAKQANEESKSVQKTYEALIMGHHELPEVPTATTSDDANPLVTLLEKGASLSQKHGGQTKPVDDITILSHPTATTTLVSITISEGKNRQIRRMFHSIGSGVMKLHRVSIGKISLAGLTQNPKAELQEGEWRLLTEEEIQLGLGWDCRWLDLPVNDGRRSRKSETRHSKQRHPRYRKRRR